MTDTQRQEFIEASADNLKEVLGKAIQDIDNACAVALEESQDSGSNTCKVRIPFRVIIDMMQSPPVYWIESVVASKKKFVSDSAQLTEPGCNPAGDLDGIDPP